MYFWCKNAFRWWNEKMTLWRKINPKNNCIFFACYSIYAPRMDFGNRIGHWFELFVCVWILNFITFIKQQSHKTIQSFECQKSTVWTWHFDLGPEHSAPTLILIQIWLISKKLWSIWIWCECTTYCGFIRNGFYSYSTLKTNFHFNRLTRAC